MKPKSGKCCYCKSSNPTGMKQYDAGRGGVRFYHRLCANAYMRELGNRKRRKAGIPIKKKDVGQGMKWCPDCQSAKPHDAFHFSKSRGLSARCRPCGIAYSKEWYRVNKDRRRIYDANRREEKRHLYRDASKKFRQVHPGRKNADTQARRAQIVFRQPSWQPNAELTVFYEAAVRVTKCLNIQHDVDHIIPLRGKTVSGLHVAGNLRVYPSRLNQKKNNRFGLEVIQ